MTPSRNTKLEAEPREKVDEKPNAASGVIQGNKQSNLIVATYGIHHAAVRSPSSTADKILFTTGKASAISLRWHESKGKSVLFVSDASMANRAMMNI